jgi:hypothetical protein
MNQLAPLVGAVPAHISATQGVDLNANAMAGVRASFPRMNFHPAFSIRWRGETTPLLASPGLDARTGKPLAPVPMAQVEVVIVGISPHISKRFYLSGWDPKREGEAPDCFSTQGTAPDAGARVPQSPVCVTCPNNKWGSKVTDAGTKIKACQDRRKIAVVPAADIANEEFGGPMLLDLPPTAMLALERYARMVRSHGADLSQVITVLSKNPQVAHELVFTVGGWIPDPADYELALELARSDDVTGMLQEEAVEVTTDMDAIAATEAHPLEQRPAHVRTPPPAAQPPAQVEAEAEPVAEPVSVPVVATARKSPFMAAARGAPAPAKPRAVAASTTPVVKAPAAAPVAAPAAGATVVVQAAPADLEDTIDNLLQSDC